MPDCTDKFFLNDVIESLDRIESGKSCQTLGASTAIAPVAVLVRCSQIGLREAERSSTLTKFRKLRSFRKSNGCHKLSQFRLSVRCYNLSRKVMFKNKLIIKNGLFKLLNPGETSTILLCNP